ncbi:MAG: hypothetical protein ABJ349_04225, partial [Hyphomicrobiales bacterium]
MTSETNNGAAIRSGPQKVSKALQTAMPLRFLERSGLVRFPAWMVHVIGPVILIGIWWIAYFFTLVDKNLLPSPFATLYDTGINIATGDVLTDFWFTTVRVFYSFIFAAIIGVPLGIVLGANNKVYRSVEFIIDFFR